MHRIFLTLAVVGNVLLTIAVCVGLSLGDAAADDPEIQSRIGRHMLFGLSALTFATLVHAICLTYFMGTGRWLEETSRAYSLDEHFYRSNQRAKYRMLPLMVICLLLLIAVGAVGAVADPASPASMDGFLGLSSGTHHLIIAVVTAVVNLITNVIQFLAVRRNSSVIEDVLKEVRRIRTERGLPVVQAD